MGYWIVRTIFVVIIKGLFRVKIEGTEHIPKESNYIIVANHASWLDPMVMVAVIPYKIYGVALRSLFRIKWLQRTLKALEAIPTGNSSGQALSLLMKNKTVGLFPEAGCSRDGKLRRFKNGAAVLALRSGRPVVPCGISGSYEAMPRHSRFPKLFSRITVKIGKPLYFLKEFDELIDPFLLEESTDKIKTAIERLCYER
ncbi:MAG: 1-acyl-sn-glycerol-3-phosphate acyltransferase [PVC group bacterium]|nr:1-acyl-sn-glycerol-3-phosphate acyltransferase [PVC group bacterium]